MILGASTKQFLTCFNEKGTEEPKDGPRWLQLVQDSPKFVQKGSEDAPKMAQDSFKHTKIAPLVLKNESKFDQTWSEEAPRSPKKPRE